MDHSVEQDSNPTAPSDRKVAPVLNVARLDWIERAIAASLYIVFTIRIYGDYRQTGHAGNLLVLALEFMVVFFILIRRPATAVSVRPTDWVFALTATCLPLMVAPSAGGPIGPPALGSALLLLGLFAQLAAKLALNRNFGLVAARRKLIMHGPYRFVRHPIYLSYFIGHVGFFLLNPTLWNFAVYALCAGFQVARVLAEERVLSSDPAYCAYCEKVRYRLVPGVF